LAHSPVRAIASAAAEIEGFFDCLASISDRFRGNGTIQSCSKTADSGNGVLKEKRESGFDHCAVNCCLSRESQSSISNWLCSNRVCADAIHNEQLHNNVLNNLKKTRIFRIVVDETVQIHFQAKMRNAVDL
jgi:hypothetical protein